VNKMCLAADIPLIESGTAGYLGQVSIHKKHDLSCFDCTPKDREKKTFPVCTIRSTPSEAIHCIVWAKSYLFANLFGKIEAESMDTQVNDENRNEVDSLQKEQVALASMRGMIGKDGAGSRIFQKVFDQDIQRLLSMEDLWKHRAKPTRLDLNDLRGGELGDRAALDFDQKVWSLKENTTIFLETYLRCAFTCRADRLGRDLMAKKKSDPLASLEFDKDDELALDFVTATANLRASVYGIEMKSRFIVKQMAGNIIPAIATTNAIIAGMIVMLAIKVVMGKLKECKNVPYPSANTSHF
jgi:ubiquitin-like 1-activating enzyme E1 B